MKIDNWLPDGSTALVIALDGANIAALTALGSKMNRLIVQGHARNKNIGMGVRWLAQRCFIVRNEKQRHTLSNHIFVTDVILAFR